MRLRLIAHAGLLGGVLACASAQPPPGGPEDRNPPKLVRVVPDSNALNVQGRDASFYFDETINDRGTGAQEVSNYFLVSPSDGAPRVSWHRSRIDVRPRNGFRPNTAYTVTLLPGLSDLRGNTMRTGTSVVFSTGSSIPTDRVTGTVFDWAAERPAAKALMQAVTPDSVTYLAQSDSAGRFALGPMPPGRYLVRAIVDQNNNRALDRNEAFDSVTVTVPVATPLELRTAVRDSLPPRILSVEVGDSTSLRVTFDRLLDPTQTFAASQFRLVGADSAAVPVTRVLTPAQLEEETRAAQQVRADSARRVDSLAGKPLPPLPRVAAPAAARTQPKPSIRPPFTVLVLRHEPRLVPSATYRLSATGVRGLSGRTQPSERSFSTPRATAQRPAADTSRGAPARRP